MNMSAASDHDVHTDALSLADVLSRLSTEPSALAKERKSLPSAPRARLNVLLREIDETVLARIVRVRSPEGELALLDIANRRLLGMTLVGRDASLAGPLADDVMAFAESLLDICQKATGYTVERPSVRDRNLGDASSYAVPALRDAMGLDHKACSIDLLSQMIEPHAVSMLTWESGFEQVVFTGAENLRAKHEAHTRRALDSIAASQKAKTTFGGDVSGVAIPVSKAFVFVLASTPEKGLSGFLPTSKGLKAISDWQLVAG